jgi:hypothetical protein
MSCDLKDMTGDSESISGQHNDIVVVTKTQRCRPKGLVAQQEALVAAQKDITPRRKDI